MALVLGYAPTSPLVSKKTGNIQVPASWEVLLLENGTLEVRSWTTLDGGIYGIYTVEEWEQAE